MKPHRSKRFILAAITSVIASLTSMTATAETELISVEDAYEKSINGEVILVDIRTPQEWTRTGTPLSARLVTLQSERFLSTINALQAERPDASVALICRSGTRSTRAAQILEEAGIKHIYNVKEGVEGSPNGTSWISKGLPLDRFPLE